MIVLSLLSTLEYLDPTIGACPALTIGHKDSGASCVTSNDMGLRDGQIGSNDPKVWVTSSPIRPARLGWKLLAACESVVQESQIHLIWGYNDLPSAGVRICVAAGRPRSRAEPYGTHCRRSAESARMKTAREQSTLLSDILA